MVYKGNGMFATGLLEMSDYIGMFPACKVLIMVGHFPRDVHLR